jgi:ABC-type multidrug transport system fused ATPase/permease subunit
MNGMIRVMILQGLDIGFWNNVGSNVAILLVYIALSIFGILSWIPFFRPHLEPDTSKSELEKSEPSPDEEKPASLFDFLKLITGKGLRTALLLLTIGAVCAGAKGYIMQKVNYYDGIAFNQARLDDTDGIMETLKITATLYGAYSLGSGLALMFSSVAAEKIINGTNGIRNKLFRNLLEQEMAYHDKLSSGVIASRFSNDAERVKQLLAEALPAFIENMSLVAFGLFFLFGTSWSLTLYMVGLVPITFGANYYQSEKLETFMEVSQTQNAAMSERIQEVFSKYMTVLTYGKQQFEQWSYARLVKNIYRTLRSKVVFTAVLVSITGFLAFGTQILAFFLGVVRFMVIDCGYIHAGVKLIWSFVGTFPSAIIWQFHHILSVCDECCVWIDRSAQIGSHDRRGDWCLRSCPKDVGTSSSLSRVLFRWKPARHYRTRWHDRVPRCCLLLPRKR